MRGSDWLLLKRKTPKNFLLLIEHCGKYADLVFTLQNSKLITSRDISQLHTYTQLVLEEYLAKFRSGEEQKEQLGDVSKDISTMLGVTSMVGWDEKNKRLRFGDPYSRFGDAQELKKSRPDAVDNFFYAFTTPMISFIDSRIYYPLLDAIEMSEATVERLFIGNTGKRSGSLQSLRQESKEPTKEKKEGEANAADGLVEQID